LACAACADGDEALRQPVHVFVQVPSCVPSAPGWKPRRAHRPGEVAEALTWPGMVGLGEMMNYPGVFSGDAQVHAEMAETRAAGKTIGGHYPAHDLGLPFHGYVPAGRRTTTKARAWKTPSPAPARACA
jgi:adenine deaminase